MKRRDLRRESISNFWFGCQILTAVYEQQLDGTVRSLDEAKVAAQALI
ncbi:MAG: hypothetical protein ABMA15_06095 [Vicinamibacterales bacterium]